MNLCNIFLILAENGITKYIRWYYAIIDKARNENAPHRKQYHEKHHILPKSLYPKYKSFRLHPWNGVLLDYKQHFICHYLLYKHFQLVGNESQKRITKRMFSSISKGFKINAREYEILRKEAQKQCKNRK